MPMTQFQDVEPGVMAKPQLTNRCHGVVLHITFMRHAVHEAYSLFRTAHHVSGRGAGRDGQAAVGRAL